MASDINIHTAQTGTVTGRIERGSPEERAAARMTMMRACHRAKASVEDLREVLAALDLADSP